MLKTASPKTNYIRSEKHLRFIASLMCLICHRVDVQAAHIRSGNGAGMGIKPSDDCTVPLCVTCHKNQHDNGEELWWSQFGGIKKATKLAKSLYAITGDRDKAETLIREF